MPVRITSEVLHLRHDFTTEEKLSMASELANIYTALQEVAEEKKRTASQYAERENTIKASVGSISRGLQVGFEMRNITCKLVYDQPNVGEVSYIDPDGKTVRTRAMTDSERQLELKLEQQAPQTEAEEQKSIEQSTKNIEEHFEGSKTKKNDGDPEGQCRNCEKWFPASKLKTTEEDFFDLCPDCYKEYEQQKTAPGTAAPEPPGEPAGDQPGEEPPTDEPEPPAEPAA